MAGFLSRLFGSKKKEVKADTPEGLVDGLLTSIIEYGQFDLQYAISHDANDLKVEFSGADEGLLRAREGQLLDSLQLFVKRVVQHQMSDEKIEITLDVGGFREETNSALIDLADKLREMALAKGKSVYFRALPPKDRKVIHQYLAEDERVKSRSIGDGHYKKIKIYPVKSSGPTNETETSEAH